MINGHKKTEFLRALADWIEQWCHSPAFTLTPQTASALTTALRAHAMLIEDLLNEAYQYVITARLQSDPVERRFSQCRRMNSGRFLVNLREVRNSERILQCPSLLKENINFWEEDLTSENQECVTDEKRVKVTTWYVAKKFIKRSKCESCKILLKAGDNDIAHDA